MVRDTGPSGHTPSDNGMFTSDSCRGGWAEVGGADVLLRMMSVGRDGAPGPSMMRMDSVSSSWLLPSPPSQSPRSVRCKVGTGSSIPELIAARSAIDFRELRGSGAWEEKGDEPQDLEQRLGYIKMQSLMGPVHSAYLLFCCQFPICKIYLYYAKTPWHI